MPAMTCVCCKSGFCLAVGGTDHVIEADGRRWRFEMHPMFGPAVLNSRGDPADKQPGPRSKFWTAVTLWSQQGRQTGADGLCVWQEPVAVELVHLGGRNYASKGSALAEKYGVQP